MATMHSPQRVSLHFPDARCRPRGCRAPAHADVEKGTQRRPAGPQQAERAREGASTRRGLSSLGLRGRHRLRGGVQRCLCALLRLLREVAPHPPSPFVTPFHRCRPARHLRPLLASYILHSIASFETETPSSSPGAFHSLCLPASPHLVATSSSPLWTPPRLHLRLHLPSPQRLPLYPPIHSLHPPTHHSPRHRLRPHTPPHLPLPHGRLPPTRGRQLRLRRPPPLPPPAHLSRLPPLRHPHPRHFNSIDNLTSLSCRPTSVT